MYDETVAEDLAVDPTMSALEMYGYDEDHHMSYAEFESVYETI
jgi:hypothetical protein